MTRRLALVAVLFLAACGSSSTQPATPDQAAAPTEAPTVVATATPVAPLATPTPMPAATPTPVPTATATPKPLAEPTAAPEPTAAEANCWVIDDFDSDSAQWQVVLDGVMGGLSNGQGTIADGALTLTGTINTNGGGFVQVRRLIDPTDLEGATSVRFVADTDGRDYEALFSDALPGRARSVSHFASIDFPSRNIDDPAESTIGTVLLADLQARSFGNPIVTEPFRPELAFSMGVILADGLDGDFVIRLDRIEACS